MARLPTDPESPAKLGHIGPRPARQRHQIQPLRHGIRHLPGHRSPPDCDKPGVLTMSPYGCYLCLRSIQPPHAPPLLSACCTRASCSRRRCMSADRQRVSRSHAIRRTVCCNAHKLIRQAFEHIAFSIGVRPPSRRLHHRKRPDGRGKACLPAFFLLDQRLRGPPPLLVHARPRPRHVLPALAVLTGSA